MIKFPKKSTPKKKKQIQVPTVQREHSKQNEKQIF